jgi:hypothetical protein
MSHPQPTPQDDDQTPIDILTRHVRNPWGQHDGWWECMCTAVHDAQHVLDELRAAGVELVSQIGTPTWVERIHRGRQGAAPKLPNAADTPRVDSPTLIESIAQWLGERESTHLWPEIHESDKACYRDAARHLLETVGGGIDVHAELVAERNTHRKLSGQANYLLARIVAAANIGAIDGSDGFVESYNLPVGPIHRAIPFLSEQGIVVTLDGQIRNASKAEAGE